MSQNTAGHTALVPILDPAPLLKDRRLWCPLVALSRQLRRSVQRPLV